MEPSKGNREVLWEFKNNLPELKLYVEERIERAYELTMLVDEYISIYKKSKLKKNHYHHWRTKYRYK